MKGNLMKALDKRSKTMRRAGAFSIAMGAVTLVTGVAIGVLSVVNGATLRSKAKL